jgi:hypothetical protein
MLPPQRKKARPKTLQPKAQFTGQETRPETRLVLTDLPSITLTSLENALLAPIQSETRPELPESRPEAAPL